MITPPPNPNPRITFAIFAYNQEKYVREAVLAALSQSYDPLEILIFDDASQDGTQRNICDAVVGYTGPHIIRLYLNTTNNGLAEQINKCFHLAKGEFIIVASGDDISRPDRTRRVVEFWLQNRKIPDAIYCGMEIMDNNGTTYGVGFQGIKRFDKDPERLLRRIHNPPRLLVGACSSYSTSVITGLGDLDATTQIEDTPMTMRASVMGGVEYLDETLVSYRVGSSTWLPEQNSQDRNLEQRLRKRLKLANAQRSALQQIYVDMSRLGRTRLATVAADRLQAKDLIISVLRGEPLSALSRITIAYKSRQWREVFVDATLFSWPRLLSCLIWVKRIFCKVGAK